MYTDGQTDPNALPCTIHPLYSSMGATVTTLTNGTVILSALSGGGECTRHNAELVTSVMNRPFLQT